MPVVVRLSEVLAGLSHALDITEGERPGHAARTCRIGMRLADELELEEAARGELFWALLLKDAGCSANSAHMAALFAADDQAAKHDSKRVDWARRLPAFLWAARTAAPGRSLATKARRLNAVREEGEVTRAFMLARCERGAEIARMLGLPEGCAGAIYALDEHWDGGGHPHGLHGEEIPLGARIMCLAQTVEIFHADGGVRAAFRVAEHRAGGWFDPHLVERLRPLRHDTGFWAELGSAGAPPAPVDRTLRIDEPALDGIADAFAAVVDAKSPWTYRHSDRTSLIATSIAAALGEAPETLRDLGRAARLHDIGKLAISNRILDKPGPLTPRERARVDEHPRITREILRRVPGLRDVADLAAAHHERLDGSGYPNAWTAAQLTLPMRALAVADVYEALTSARPYRPARSSDEALAVLRAQAPERLDGEAVATLEHLLDGGEPHLTLVRERGDASST